MKHKKHWRSMSEHQQLAVKLVRIAFEELHHGVPNSQEGKLHMAAELIGKFMATIAHWERVDDLNFPLVIDGEQPTPEKGRLIDGN